MLGDTKWHLHERELEVWFLFTHRWDDMYKDKRAVRERVSLRIKQVRELRSKINATKP